MEGPESLQPLAPQAPGNVLYGRFKRVGMNWKTWVILGGVVLLIWWFVRRARA